MEKLSTKKERLLDRLNDNYEDFKQSMSGVSRDKLFASAGRIAAVTEAYEMLTGDHDWEDEYVLDFFLLFRDPLTVVADAWEKQRGESKGNYVLAMYDSYCDERTVSQYPLMEGVYDDILYLGSVDNDDFGFVIGV